jgi:hypothetical protein
MRTVVNIHNFWSNTILNLRFHHFMTGKCYLFQRPNNHLSTSRAKINASLVIMFIDIYFMRSNKLH